MRLAVDHVEGRIIDQQGLRSALWLEEGQWRVENVRLQ